MVGKITSKKNKVGFDSEATVEKQSSLTFMELIKDTMVRWAKESVIQDPVLVREIFRLLYKRYNGIGEVKDWKFLIIPSGSQQAVIRASASETVQTRF